LVAERNSIRLKAQINSFSSLDAKLTVWFLINFVRFPLLWYLSKANFVTFVACWEDVSHFIEFTFVLIWIRVSFACKSFCDRKTWRKMWFILMKVNYPVGDYKLTDINHQIKQLVHTSSLNIRTRTQELFGL